MRPKPERHGGFTLLEVLVALSILAIAVTIILQIFTGGLKTIAASGNASEAMMQADGKMREILREPNLSERKWRDTSNESYPMDISAAEVWRDRTEGLGMKAMEIELTVRWREGQREKNFTIRTVKTISMARTS
ncbi:MAG: type II secretion system protein [Smithellaceae bacterium]|nr:type II secretion system protein [Smithellaceae bacterium]